MSLLELARSGIVLEACAQWSGAGPDGAPLTHWPMAAVVAPLRCLAAAAAAAVAAAAAAAGGWCRAVVLPWTGKPGNSGILEIIFRFRCKLTVYVH